MLASFLGAVVMNMYLARAWARRMAELKRSKQNKQPLFRMVRQKGMLEITWWEIKHRLWFKVLGIEWIEKSIPLLKEQIEKLLHKTGKPDRASVRLG